ncbi:hypothetical protein MTR67_022672 [Solanum verrucosum]|uniref:Uncharacterized protein n=1 Tax=Solanum verrucosum TaxID=315347 RepID=A0AAF0TQQ5_SOLVR|nr:hypothetical protein MTR67_022672 [Solanum verrucosum]
MNMSSTTRQLEDREVIFSVPKKLIFVRPFEIAVLRDVIANTLIESFLPCKLEFDKDCSINFLFAQSIKYFVSKMC